MMYLSVVFLLFVYACFVVLLRLCVSAFEAWGVVIFKSCIALNRDVEALKDDDKAVSDVFICVFFVICVCVLCLQ